MLIAQQDRSLMTNLAQALSGRHFLITGGSGFVARVLTHFIDELNATVSAGIYYTTLSRRALAHESKWASHLQMDLGDEKTVRGISGEWSDVIHCAAPLPDPKGNQSEIAELIEKLGQNALGLAKASGAQRFLLVSSGAVYGTAAKSPMAESQVMASEVPDRESGYAIGKRATEKFAQEFCTQNGIEWLIARVFSVSGPLLPADHPFVLSLFASMALKNKKIIITGSPDVTRSFLDSSDLATWILTTIAKARSGTVINVGSNQAVSVRELAEEIARQIPGTRVEFRNGEEKPGASQRYLPSVERAEREFGLSRQVDFSSTIERTIASMSEELKV